MPSLRAHDPLRSFALALALALSALPSGCRQGPDSVEDPASVLSRTGLSREAYFDAVDAARMRGVDDATTAALRRMISAPGYPIDSRERAFALLLEHEPSAIEAALANSLPRMNDVSWRRRVCQLVGEARLESMVPTLIRAWAVPVGALEVDDERPERLAIAAIVGGDRVSATLLATMREANPLTQANLRARCWELLMKSGDEVRLRALLAESASTEGDAMLMDLARVSRELGVLPTTREEILWARALCEPAREAFLAEARAALARMPVARREALELRGVPVAVAAARLRPDLLAATEPDLFAEVVARTRGGRHASPDFTGYGNGFTENPVQQRDQLVWSDLAAMLLAMDALADERFRRELFALADRDLEDRTTEFGGVIGLDASGGLALREFEPRSRASDLRYESPQALFDALYTGLFHFHLHAQKYENTRYAGPHLGDFAFAESTRANALVFTFLRTDELGADFYRHGRIVVDLGAAARPEG
jgi:hypothetical protein